MPIFYTPDILSNDTHYVLSEEESKHCIRVLRMKAGDVLTLTDGRGGMYTSKLKNDHPKKCELELIESQMVPSPEAIHLAIAPTKNLDRMEWLVEKGTELGCTHFSFIQTKNSERNQLKLDRLEKIAISAMKQSQRAHLPKLDALIPFKDFLSLHPNGWIAHCQAQDNKMTISNLNPKRLLIGPEGDFTFEEIEWASKAGYSPCTLGSARLRTETAALRGLIELLLC